MEKHFITNPDTEQSAIYIKAPMLVTGEDVIQTNRKVAACHSLAFQLWDFSATRSYTISPEQTHKLALQDAAIPAHAKLEKVALVGNPLLFYGHDEVYHIYSKDWVGRQKNFESRSFISTEAAWKWFYALPDS